MREKCWIPIKRYLIVLFVLSLFAVPAHAAEKKIDVYLNGDLLNIPPSFGEPFYDTNNRLQIPMRYIIQSCGYDVIWNNAQQTATVSTQNGDVVVTLGSEKMSTPKGSVTMDTAAMAKDQRTYLPLRYVLEALGFQVTWTAGVTADQVKITGTIGAASSRVPMTAAEISAQASPAVVYIEVSDLNGNVFASGSGFFIDPTGVGVTNYHVIEGAYSAQITASDGTEYDMGMVLYYDKERDIAVFDAIPKDTSITWGSIPYLDLAVPSSIHNGDVVYAIGSPYGLQNSITDGLVSNKDRVLDGERYIQTSAPISSGNSGGPLLNEYGEVIGINTATLAVGQNINLAVPVSDLAKVDYQNQDEWMFLFQVADREAVPAPKNLRVVNQTEDTAYIQWDPVSGAEYYHFYYQQNGEKSYWYDEDTVTGGPKRFYYTSGHTVEYFGLKPGTSYNVIVTAVKDGIESPDSEVLHFTFSGTGTGEEMIVRYYVDAPWLPDFGAVSGKAPVYYTKNDDGFICFYDVAVSPYVENYIEILSQQGYLFDDAMSELLGEGEFNVPMYFYIPGTEFSVVCDVDAETGYIMIVALT